MHSIQNKLHWIEAEQMKRCKEEGFVNLDFEEGLSEITGKYQHHALVVDTGETIVRVWISYEEAHKSGKTVYNVEVSVYFDKGNNGLGDLSFSSRPFYTESLDLAFDYAKWKATLAYKYIFNDSLQI